MKAYEHHLVSMIRVKDEIQALTGIPSGEEDIAGMQMIENPIDQFQRYCQK